MGQPMPVNTWTKLVWFPGDMGFQGFSDSLTWHTGSRICSREGNYFQQERCDKVGVPQQPAGLKHWPPTALGEVYQGGID